MIVTVLFNGLWQGALVVAVTAAALRLVSPRSAATRYAAWFAALIAILATPVLTATSHWGAAIAAAMQHGARSNGGVFSLVPLYAVSPVRSGPMFSAFSSTQALTAIAALWSAGAAAGFLRLAVSLHRIAQIRRAAMPFSQADGVPVLVSTDLTIPIAGGILSPAIVLPSTLAHDLTQEQLACTIEHELAHIRRGDVVTNFIQRIVEALLFWSPWVYVVGRKLVRERECACDDRAAISIGESADYAACLAALARRITAAPIPLLTPSAFGSRNALVDRIERLTSGYSRNDSAFNYIALGAVTMLLIALTLVLQVLTPAPLGAATLDAPARTKATLWNATATSGCANRNVPPITVDAAAPDLPKSEMPSHKVSAIVAVTVATDGKPVATRIERSSGYPKVDDAVLAAAKKSTYSPKLVNCTPLQSTYLFKADFAP